jgi:TolB-like protein
MTTGLLAAFCASALAILPTVNRDRDRDRDHDRDQASRPIVGDESPIRQVKVTAEALEAARREFARQSRIAVLPFAAAGGDHGALLAALGCTEAMTDDLHYVRGMLVVEGAEVAHARRTLKTPQEIGRKLDARYLITGTLSRDGTDFRLEAEAIEIGPSEVGTGVAVENGPAPPARASASRPGSQLYELADAVLLDLLAQRKATLEPERLAGITCVPTLRDTARVLCDDGFAWMDRAEGMNRGDDPDVCLRALKESEAAMKVDPMYLRAALLQESCLLRMGELARLESCLSQACQLTIPENRIDALTRLEIDGDHAVFVKHDFPTAVAHYQKMLAIDPGHLRALWMLAAIHAGEYESSGWPGHDLEKAGEYAARLLVAHPGTNAARVFATPKP